MRQAQLRWEQINPQVAERVGERLRLTERMDIPHVTRQGKAVSSGESVRAWAFSAFVATLFIGLYLCVFFNFGEVATTAFAVLPVGLLVSTTSPASVRKREAAERRLRGPIRADQQLRAAFDQIAVSRAERLYGEIVCALAAEPETGDRQLRREILRECNLLLRDYFRIHDKRQRATRLATPEQSLLNLEITSERAALEARRDAASDFIAQESWRESLSLLEERADSVRSLHNALARLEAHEEVLCQALALAHAALIRASISQEQFRAPEIAHLRRAVRRLTARATAEDELDS
jgi:hypothetical protein